MPAQGSVSCRSSFLALQSYECPPLPSRMQGSKERSCLGNRLWSMTSMGLIPGSVPYRMHAPGQMTSPLPGSLFPQLEMGLDLPASQRCEARRRQNTKAPGPVPGPEYVLRDVTAGLRCLDLTPQPARCQCSEPME